MRKNPDKTRESLLLAANEEIRIKGFQAASLSTILTKAGLTKGAMYHHFPNKLALGYAVVDEIFPRELQDVFMRPVAAEGHFVDGFKRALMEGERRDGEWLVKLGCPANNLAQEMSAIDEGFRLRLEYLFRWWRDGIARAIRQGQRDGHLRADIDPESAALFIQAALEGCVSLSKIAQSRTIFRDCLQTLIGYLESMRSHGNDEAVETMTAKTPQRKKKKKRVEGS